MIKLFYSCVLGIVAGTCLAYSVKAQQPTVGCVTNTIVIDGRMVMCTTCYYPGGSTTNCI